MCRSLYQVQYIVFRESNDYTDEEQVRGSNNMNNVIVYSKNNCMQCKMTKRFLKEHNVPFEERNINQEPQYLDALKQQGFQSVPVVMNSNMDPIVGFRPDSLKELVG